MPRLVRTAIFTIVLIALCPQSPLAQVPGVDTESGFRMGQYRAPTPEVLNGGTIIHAEELRTLMRAEQPVLIDVMGTGDIPFDPFSGEWPLVRDRETIEGAYWLPEIGRGYQDDDVRRYYKTYMQRLTAGDKSRPIVFFCVSDCWMAWNAARRSILEGYRRIYWFPEGTDGWVEQGFAVKPVRPERVPIED